MSSTFDDIRVDPRDRATSARFLHGVFTIPRFADARYLTWLYDRNPEGPALVIEAWSANAPVAHYCLTPQKWQNAGKRSLFAYPVNLAVAGSLRRQRVFVTLGRATHARSGFTALVAAANARSTPGFVKHLGFAIILSLPVRVGVTLPDRSAASETHTFEGLDLAPPSGWRRAWTPELLAWRLSAPSARYAAHRSESGVLISTIDRAFGMPVMIVLRLFPAVGVERMRTQPLIRAAAAYWRTPVYLYAGTNDRARVSGLRPPRRLLPSPLHFIYCPLAPEAPPAEAFRPASFEFLDFDAY